jgi:hypothetical protein
MKLTKRQVVNRQLEELDHLDARALRARWHGLYGTAPPSRIGAAILRKAVAYRVQELAFGGLTPATKRLITILAVELDVGSGAPPTGRLPHGKPRRKKRSLPIGAQLVREWNGGAVVVDVLPEGYAWQGQRYRSLSAVATAITGTRWSGPRFFGLSGKGPASRARPSEFTGSIGRDLMS